MTRRRMHAHPIRRRSDWVALADAVGLIIILAALCYALPLLGGTAP